jgi:hypothetical protein
MQPAALKAAAFENFAALQARAPDGKARRGT